MPIAVTTDLISNGRTEAGGLFYYCSKKCQKDHFKEVLEQFSKYGVPVEGACVVPAGFMDCGHYLYDDGRVNQDPEECARLRRHEKTQRRE